MLLYKIIFNIIFYVRHKIKHKIINFEINNFKLENMLEAIGLISIIAVLFFLLNQYHENNNDIKQKRNKLIKNSSNCDKLIYDYEKSLIKGNPIMSRQELDKKIDDILKVEKEDILERIKNKEKEEIEKKRILRENRKVGYKYELEKIKIFNNNKELSESQLKEGIKKQMNVLDLDKIEEIINIWRDNGLVSECEWNVSKFKIGSILIYDFYKIDQDDITWYEWIKKNRIELKPDSKEYNDFYGLEEDRIRIPLSSEN